jgi:hypothetical protein
MQYSHAILLTSAASSGQRGRKMSKNELIKELKSFFKHPSCKQFASLTTAQIKWAIEAAKVGEKFVNESAIKSSYNDSKMKAYIDAIIESKKFA